MLLTKVETNITWIRDIAEIPILGHIFLFILIFVPAVLLSFTAQAVIPGLQNDAGFTKAMLVLLPAVNLVMWFSKIKLFLFFIPSWIFLGVIALIKMTLFLTGQLPLI